MADTNQILRLAAIIREVDGTHSKGAAALAESILDHPRFRAVLADEPAVPKPKPTPKKPPASPTKRELFELLLQSGGATQCVSIDWIESFANAVLARWGKVAPVPVPVSERLPGPEVCVPHPRTKRGNWCWGFERCEVSLARPARWRLMHMEAVEMEASHWLPAHALPLPEVGE